MAPGGRALSGLFPILGQSAAPTEPGEAVPDLVALAVELLVVVVLDLAVTQGRDAGFDAALGKSSAKAIAVIAFVPEQDLGPGQAGKQQGSAPVVAHLAFGEQQDDRPALAITDGMELGVQPAFGAPDTSGKSPPFRRLAAVRCALRCVASIMIASGSPALPASSAKMRLNTPILLQRMKRL